MGLASDCPTCGAATYTTPSGGTLHFVVIPSAWHDRVWKAEVAGAERVFIGTPNGTQLVLAEDNQIHLRSDVSTQLSLLVAPNFASVAVSASTPRGKVVGVDQTGLFSRIAADVGTANVPEAAWTLTAPAASPRAVPTAGSGKAEEPNGADWLGAAKYSVMLGTGASGGPQSNVDLRIQVHHHPPTPHHHHHHHHYHHHPPTTLDLELCLTPSCLVCCLPSRPFAFAPFRPLRTSRPR